MKTYSSVPRNERLRDIQCPVCGGAGIVLFWDCGDFTFSRCVSCGHVYQNPQPLFDDLASRYKESYFDYELTNEEAFFRLMLLGLADIGFPEWEDDAKTKGMFLDIGCATGMLLAHMQARGWSVQGVEICRASALYGQEKRGVPIFIGPLEKSNLPTESFSLVHASHLIEHVPDPRALLLSIHGLLVPGGHAVIVTPNRGGFQARLLGRKWRSCIADHLHLFDRRRLSRLLTECGFTIRKVQTWGGIARGMAPGWIKEPLDKAAKNFGFGDVMLYWVGK